MSRPDRTEASFRARLAGLEESLERLREISSEAPHQIRFSFYRELDTLQRRLVELHAQAGAAELERSDASCWNELHAFEEALKDARLRFTDNDLSDPHPGSDDE